MVDCTSIQLAFFLLRHNQTLRTIEFESVELVDSLDRWPWLLQVVRDSMHITHFWMSNCSLRMSTGKPVIQYGDPWEASDTEGLTHIIDMMNSSNG